MYLLYIIYKFIIYINISKLYISNICIQILYISTYNFLSLLRGWVSLTMAFTGGKFMYI